MNPGKRQLRHTLRAERRALDATTRIESALALARALLGSDAFRRSARIAAFVAADGELDPGPFIASARALGRTIHLPVLDRVRDGRLRFIRTEEGERLHPNRYGIPEPHGQEECGPSFLDLVLVPLVAFDRDGNRLGMGAGYYDRTFAYLPRRAHWRKPRLVGVGYSFQRVDAGLDAEPWDVPLWAVATEEGVTRCGTG